MKLSHVFRAKAMQEDDSMKEFDREHETTRADVQHAFNVLYRKASQTNVSLFTVYYQAMKCNNVLLYIRLFRWSQPNLQLLSSKLM